MGAEPYQVLVPRYLLVLVVLLGVLVRAVPGTACTSTKFSTCADAEFRDRSKFRAQIDFGRWRRRAREKSPATKIDLSSTCRSIPKCSTCRGKKGKNKAKRHVFERGNRTPVLPISRTATKSLYYCMDTNAASRGLYVYIHCV